MLSALRKFGPSVNDVGKEAFEAQIIGLGGGYRLRRVGGLARSGRRSRLETQRAFLPFQRRISILQEWPRAQEVVEVLRVR